MIRNPDWARPLHGFLHLLRTVLCSVASPRFGEVSCGDHTWSLDHISLYRPRARRRPVWGFWRSCRIGIFRSPSRKRVCIRGSAVHSPPPFRLFLPPAPSLPDSTRARFAAHAPHYDQEYGVGYRLPVPLQPGRVFEATPVPRCKRWRSSISINWPLVRVTARETSPLYFLRVLQDIVLQNIVYRTSANLRRQNAEKSPPVNNTAAECAVSTPNYCHLGRCTEADARATPARSTTSPKPWPPSG